MSNLNELGMQFLELVQGFLEYRSLGWCVVIDVEWDDENYLWYYEGEYNNCIIIQGDWDDDPIKSR
jgi:hypothetical protein